jgi:hypothetical protein
VLVVRGDSTDCSMCMERTDGLCRSKYDRSAKDSVFSFDCVFKDAARLTGANNEVPGSMLRCVS